MPAPTGPLNPAGAETARRLAAEAARRAAEAARKAAEEAARKAAEEARRRQEAAQQAREAHKSAAEIQAAEREARAAERAADEAQEAARRAGGTAEAASAHARAESASDAAAARPEDAGLRTLLDAQVQAGASGLRPAEGGAVARDAFVREGAALGGTEAERATLFDKYDQDGHAGLSDAEFDAAFAEATAGREPAAPPERVESRDRPAAAGSSGAERSPEDPEAYVRQQIEDGKLSEDVASELDNALKDDKDTDGDFSDAASKARTRADVDAIVATARAKGRSEEDALNQLLDKQHGSSDSPRTEIFEAVAAHYERLDQPEKAGLVRLVGDPETSKGVREHLKHAIQDGKDTERDLEQAARAARTGPEFEAVMQAQAIVGKGYRPGLVQEALLGIDEKEKPGPKTQGLLRAIADAYEAMDQPDAARAARDLANPDLDAGVRENLIHALQDNISTGEDIEKAFDHARTAADTRATRAAGEATVGERRTEALQHQDAYHQTADALKDAWNAYDEAKHRVEVLNGDLQTALGSPLLDDRQKQQVQEAFLADNKADFDALTAAQDRLADLVEQNKDTITRVLSDPTAYESQTNQGAREVAADHNVSDERLALPGDPGLNSDIELFTNTLHELAGHPDHFELASDVMTPVLAASKDQLTPDGKTQGSYNVVPELAKSFDALVQNDLAKRASQAPDTPEGVEQALQDFQDSPFYQNATALHEKIGEAMDLKQGFQEIREIASLPPARSFEKALDTIEGNPTFGKTFAGFGLTFGAVSGANSLAAGDYRQAVEDFTGAGADGAELAGALARTGGRIAAVSEGASAVLGPAAGALSAFTGLQDAGAAFGEFAEDGDRTELAKSLLALGGAGAGIAAMMSVPGANVAVVVFAAGAYATAAVEAHADANASTSRIMDTVRGLDMPVLQQELFAYSLPGSNQDGGGRIMAALRDRVDVSDDDAEAFEAVMKDAATDNAIESYASYVQEVRDELGEHAPAGARRLLEEMARQLGVSDALA